MKFRLIFEGEIRPRQKAKLEDIHEIRRQLHPQLKKAWEHEPLSVLKDKWLRPLDGEKKDGQLSYARIEELNGKKYAPLISTHLAAELDIIFLRQQARGQLIGEGGDIDNRLKTLFDALRMPSKAEAMQLSAATADDEDPLHCLLKDDALIHRVNVETDRLLRPGKTFDLLAIINVTVLVTFVSWDTTTLTAN
jgi:hypothetical protein